MKVAVDFSDGVHSDVSSTGYASSRAFSAEYSPELNRLLDELYMPPETQQLEQAKPSSKAVQNQPLWSSVQPAPFTTNYREETRRRLSSSRSSVAAGIPGEKQTIPSALPTESYNRSQIARPTTYLYSTPAILLSDPNSSSKYTKSLSATQTVSKSADEVPIVVWAFRVVVHCRQLLASWNWILSCPRCLFAFCWLFVAEMLQVFPFFTVLVDLQPFFFFFLSTWGVGKCEGVRSLFFFMSSSLFVFCIYIYIYLILLTYYRVSIETGGWSCGDATGHWSAIEVSQR